MIYRIEIGGWVSFLFISYAFRAETPFPQTRPDDLFILISVPGRDNKFVLRDFIHAN